MFVSIINSIKLIDPVWQPFTKHIKSKQFHPLLFYIKIYHELSVSVSILSEVFPPYALGWIKVELSIEEHFKKVLLDWDTRINSTKPPTIEDSVKVIRDSRRYLRNIYDKLLLNNIRIKKLIKLKVMQNVENITFLDTLGRIDFSSNQTKEKEN